MNVNITIARKAPIVGLRLSEPATVASCCRRLVRTLARHMGIARKKLSTAGGQAKRYIWRRRASNRDPEAGKPEIAKTVPPKPGSDPYEGLGPVIGNQLALLCKNFRSPQLEVEIEKMTMDIYNT